MRALTVNDLMAAIRQSYYCRKVVDIYLTKLLSHRHVMHDIDIKRNACYCSHHSIQTCYLRHQILVVNRNQSHNPYRRLWGRTKDPEAGDLKAGVKTKDVILASNLFKDIPDKHKEQFLTIVDNFQNYKIIKRHGYSEFITAALPYLKEYGLERDLDTYKSLMNVFPKGRFIPKSRFSAGILTYPLEQRTALSILCEMEKYDVMPDKEMEGLIIDIFSKYSSAWRKCGRMIYWMTKLKNLNPFPLPEELPLDGIQLATIALNRMCLDIQTKFSVYSTAQLTDSGDKTWIVSAQSPSQKEIISELSTKESVFVDGPFKVWLKNMAITYFVLKANNKNPVLDENDDNEVDDVSRIPLSNFGKVHKSEALNPAKNMHLQDDGIILAVCATGTSSRDSLMSWIHILQSTNPKLKSIPVIFTLRVPTTQLETVNEADSDR